MMSSESVSPAVLANRWNALKAALVSKAPGTTAALVTSVFASDASVVYVPTAAGATGIPALEIFFRKVTDHNEIVVDEKIVNRVASASAIAEESILTVVHDSTIEWLLPDVKPTKRRVLIPMSSFVLFDSDGKIKALRVYWDQGSVMKQIGLLPASLFCKANGSETVPPVLGPKIVDRLTNAHAEPNLIVKEHWEDAPSAGTPSGKAHGDTCATRAHGHEPAHGIVPTGDSDQDMHEAAARRLARASNESLKSRFDENAPLPSAGTPRKKPTEMAKILENAPGSNPGTVRSSTRIHHQQAAKNSDIFNVGPVVPVQTAHGSGYHGSAAAAAEDGVAAAGVGPRTSMARRDPNWSSLSNEADSVPVTTGKKIFKPSETAARHSRVDGDVDYGTVGRKHFRGAPENKHFDFAGGDAQAAEPQTSHRKHSAFAGRDNDIFGQESSAVRPKSGKRDPNARSTEHDVIRPSSRVLGPPGGTQSFSFA